MCTALIANKPTSWYVCSELTILVLLGHVSVMESSQKFVACMPAQLYFFSIHIFALLYGLLCIYFGSRSFSSCCF